MDTYYYCSNGLLKIREINKHLFELIYYQRPNKKGPKISNFQIISLKINQTKAIKNLLQESIGIRKIIKKIRHLWMYKNTTVHLDTVLGLGKFIELETVVKNISLKQAKIEHAEILKILSLSKAKRFSKSYCEIKT